MSVKGIYGLSGSGIDVESMVKAGMLSKQSQYDSMYKKEVKNSWIKSEYSSFYTSMYTFKYTTMSNYKMQSTMNAMSASSSDSTTVSATANGAAASMNHKVTVSSLTSNAYLLSTGTITRANTSSSSSIYLKDVAFSSFSSATAYSYGGTVYDESSVTKNSDGTYTIAGIDGTLSASDVTTTAKYTVTNKTNYDASKMTNIKYGETDYTGISYEGSKYTLTASDGTTKTVSASELLSSGTTFTINGSTVAGDKVSINTSSTTSDGTTKYTIGSYGVTATNTYNASDTALSMTLSDSLPTYTYDGTTYTSSQVTKNSDGTYKITASDGTSVGSAISADSVTVAQTKKTVSYTYQELADGKTLNDLASDVNSSGANITAKYDSTNDAFSLYNNDGGADNLIALTATTGAATSLLNNLGLGSTDGTTLGSAKTFMLDDTDTTAGVSGSVTIDGKTYSNLSSNKLTVSGVTYTFNNTTAAGASTTVSVSQDTDSIIASVKQFVSDYNTMLDSLNDKYYETQYSDYAPLTSSQESSMTEAQITKWNEKAKSGLLYHSSIIRNIVSSMREAIYTPVDSVDSDYNSASAIGITSSNNKGHLTLDEDKLKEALTADPDCVYQIFASDQDESTTSTSSSVSSFKAASNYKNTGLANRLYDVMTTSMDTISDYAGTSDETDDQSYLGTLITNLQTRMSNFKTQMDAYEEILYNKYDAMETAIATLSSQLSSVTGSSS